MFKILIVEDKSEKLKNILQVLEKITGIDVDTIDHDLDSTTAKLRLKKDNYDLLILDISIPLRKSEDIDPEGGLKLLKEITQRDIYKVPVHIIGLTAHKEIFDKANEEFESQLISLIRYSESDIEWQNKIASCTERIVSAKNNLSNSNVEYNYDVAIITAVEIEFTALKELSTKWQKVVVHGDASPYYETEFKGKSKTFRVVIACARQMGMNASSTLSMKMIYNFRPRYLFMTGIAASIKSSDTHGFGDIFVIDESWDGGAGKITEENGMSIFQQTANNHRADQDLTEKIRSIKDDKPKLRLIKDKWGSRVAPNTELSIHIGSVASVAGVIENSAVIDELKRKDRKLLGIEMEVYGMYYSANNCSNPKPKVMALKSVSDFANTTKNDQYQPYASFTSAQVLYEFIINEIE